MKKIKQDIAGFICFFCPLSLSITVSIIIYSKIQNEESWLVVLLILLQIVVIALLCTFIDIFRRKIMIEQPLKEILEATKKMAKGDFDVKINISRDYDNYDEFDYIKDDLNRLAVELSKNEILKKDFVSNVSHEIKTPLSVIQNYAKLLSCESLDESTRKKYCENMQISCKKINDLISNILRLNKLENQNLQLDIQEFNLSELLIEQIMLYEEKIDKKSITLHCNIQEGLIIKSVPGYMEIVINNLISNAVKFANNKGNIEINLYENDDKCVIEVKDDGCGMDSATGNLIFEKFYQGDTSHSSEGNGLGLALVKRVIDIIGGSINVESEIGKGSLFRVLVRRNQNER